MTSRALRILVATAVLLAVPYLTHDLEAQQENQGFLYGRVTTSSGNEYIGFLRWGTQEGFWDDLFHSTKDDLPFYRYVDRNEGNRRRGRGTRVRVLDRELRVEYSGSRQFISRFGDIASIEPDRRGRTRVLMKSGSEYQVNGGGDVSDRVHVKDAALGEIDLRWDRIERVEFMPAPRDADPGATRLFGLVETAQGEFEGFIQWDMDEGMSTDVLDGDTDDGDVSIRMGAIRTIERLSRRAAVVGLMDGRELRLEGSNDVNEDNRGIMVEDDRFGRVTVDWQSFDRVTFAEPGSSGRGFGDFPPLGELRGTVLTEDGRQFSGRIGFDLDEGEGWEILNGNLDRIAFDIPLAMVASVEPLRNAATVTLTTGETLTLDGTHDVNEDNSGILVFVGEEPVYIAWRDVGRITFDH